VADNGSDDGTRSCVERWSERDPRIRVVDASARPGAGAARNIGVQSARGRMLAFCDADDVVLPGWLAAMVAALADSDLVAGVFDFSSLNGGPTSDPTPAATRQMGFLPFALGANLGVRRDAFEAVHGFCETIPPSEDTDLSWRLQLAGFQFAVTPAAAVAKREHAAGKPTFHAAWAYGWCAALLFRHYRAEGMRRDLRGAAKAWVWLVGASPGLVRPSRRRQWVRTFGIRTGRLAGSVKHHAFFP
jgi:GT2 family glycosyltransferase